jgi:hypothetical protein
MPLTGRVTPLMTVNRCTPLADTPDRYLALLPSPQVPAMNCAVERHLAHGTCFMGTYVDPRRPQTLRRVFLHPPRSPTRRSPRGTEGAGRRLARRQSQRHPLPRPRRDRVAPPQAPRGLHAPVTHGNTDIGTWIRGARSARNQRIDSLLMKALPNIAAASGGPATAIASLRLAVRRLALGCGTRADRAAAPFDEVV